MDEGTSATSPQLTTAMGTCRGVSVCWGEEGPDWSGQDRTAGRGQPKARK